VVKANPDRFTLAKRPSTHYTGGSVRCTADLGGFGEQKITPTGVRNPIYNTLLVA